MRLRLTVCAAAVLLASFGAAGSINGLWATPDARASSLDGLKLAMGLPYGNTTPPRKVEMRASPELAGTSPAATKPQRAHAAPHKSLVAEVFQGPLAHATPRLVMADAAPQFDAHTPVTVPAPPEPPAPPMAPAAAFAPASLKGLKALAEAEASRSAKWAEQAVDAAKAAEKANIAAVQISLDGPMVITQSQYEGLERALDQALARLEVSQALAARINEQDPSFFVVRADGRKFCGTAQIDRECTLLRPTDVARIRSDVAAQVKLADRELRQIQAKLARARLTDG
ncbi:hypothetical protein [Aquidulcibacter sp.]|uniref:hypothetical protein n=1 Tax=Aquidulcibacter sp. TaxID=2052990 RepID=UPI0037C039EE